MASTALHEHDGPAQVDATDARALQPAAPHLADLVATAVPASA